MRLEWILLNPATLPAMEAVIFSISMILFWSLKRDLWRAEKRWKSRIEGLEAGFRAKTQKVGERWEESSQASQPALPAIPRSALNQTKRSQALQMLRRGAAPHEVAATLSLSSGEVNLLVKVNEIALAPPVES